MMKKLLNIFAKAKPAATQQMPTPPSVDAAAPEPAMPTPLFGYKTGWLGFEATSLDAVLAALGGGAPVAYSDHAADIYDQGRQQSSAPGVTGLLFEPQNGMCLCHFGLSPALDTPEQASGLLDALAGLSKQTGPILYFGSYRVVDYYAWARAENGKITRAFALVEGEAAVWRGAVTPEEREVNVMPDGVTDAATFEDALYDEETDTQLNINEDGVLALSRAWGASPEDLPMDESQTVWRVNLPFTPLP